MPRLGVKDLFDTAGLTTTYGSAVFRDHVPARTAEAVERLERAGYAVVGKTNLYEFAFGVISENPHFGPVVNPLDPARTAGGSSSGSAAALAARLCDVALGTDSGGSIRIPAACCGVVGLKPSHGLVPLEGCFPLAPTFDHAGPMARTVGACADALAALAPSFRPRELDGLHDVELGVAWLDLADPLVRTRVEAAAAHFPRRRPVDLPLLEGIDPLFMREVADVHRSLLAEHGERYGAVVRRRIERCLEVDDAAAEAARAAREEYRERCDAVTEGLDLLLLPTLGFVAPPRSLPERAVREAVVRTTLPFNALGWPVLALPCGPAEHGLPASVSLAGRPGDDALVLAAGAALERRLGAWVTSPACRPAVSDGRTGKARAS